MVNLDADRPYASKTFAEVVDDYVLVRGDLCEQYARDQLVREHEARLSIRLAEVENSVRALRFAKEEGTLRGPDNFYNGVLAAQRTIARAYLGETS